MKSVILLALSFTSLAMAFDMVEDDDGQAYYLVPLQRERRQTSVDISGGGGGGTSVLLGHKGNIFENDNHRLDGGAFASKQFRPTGPTTVGGSLDYAHKPSGSGLSLGASNTHRMGTDLSAQGKLNLYSGNGGNTRLDAVGQYSRHYGGPRGTSDPNYYGGLQFEHRFP